MARVVFLCLITLLSSNLALASPVVIDSFNSYNNGPIVGQGGWESYVGDGFQVQGSITFEGSGALYCNSIGDNVIGRQGSLLMDGRQVVWVRTENRSGWNVVTTDDGNAQLRITNGLWGAGIFMTFTRDGYVTYFDPVLYSLEKFAQYNDNEWTMVETEWRSSDATARYRVNNDAWTDWKPLWSIGSFTGLNYLNFAFDFRNGGTGGVYFDNAVPEPTTIGLLTIGLIAILRRK